MIKILVTGANGQLGTALRKAAPQYTDRSFLFTDVDDLDLTDKKSLASYLSRQQPDYIIHCAAFTQVDRAEEEPEQAYRLNADVIHDMLALAEKKPFRLIYISTDYVFDGTACRPYREEDAPNPGRYMAKQNMKENRLPWDILTPWLFVHPGFIPRQGTTLSRPS